MPVPVDLTGRTFGRLTVLHATGERTRYGRVWQCRCACGEDFQATAGVLGNGNTSSCGCARKEKTIARNTSHGMAHSPEYSVWQAMRKRCRNPNDAEYANYGGRGVIVEDRWNDSFQHFYEDLGPRPSPQHSIERADPNGNYGPANCRWATPVEQSRNRRVSRMVTCEGRTINMADLAEVAGVNYDKLKYRLNKGMTPEEAIADIRSGR